MNWLVVLKGNCHHLSYPYQVTVSLPKNISWKFGVPTPPTTELEPLLSVNLERGGIPSACVKQRTCFLFPPRIKGRRPRDSPEGTGWRQETGDWTTTLMTRPVSKTGHSFLRHLCVKAGSWRRIWWSLFVYLLCKYCLNLHETFRDRSLGLYLVMEDIRLLTEIWKNVGFLQKQWFRALVRCRIATLNFSMGFNIISPYGLCYT